LTGAHPVIDGRLDEAVWAEADVAAHFTQFAPAPGAAASEPTEARVLYDDDAIYVGLTCFDSVPDSIVGPLARRDFTGYSDWVHVMIDSYHDRRTAFRFAVNPRGVQKDVLHYNDTNEDISWDAVWDAATHMDTRGWTAEMRIPLSQLRFSARADGDQSWGINFLRQVVRRNERAFWAPVPPAGGAMVSVFGDLRGLSGLRAPRHLEIAPYSLARVTSAPGDPRNPFYERRDPFAAAGADIKYGLTSNLTLTATFNPDFGQVEADPSVVNLTAFETFFPEKRPFFVEGATFFRLDANFPYFVRGGSFGNDQLFYSRRIGRTPQGAPPDTALYFDMPDATTILGAAKLSGKTAAGWTIGAMEALTGTEHVHYVDAGGNRLAADVEPLTNYGVLRLIKDYRAGQSAVGAILTTAHRALDDARLDFLRSAAYAGGLDARHRFGGARYELTASLLGSRIEGSPRAIARVQQASSHYFQRPDASHLTYDPTRTSLDGTDANVRLAKVAGAWQGWLVGHARTPGFELNDLGYMRNADWLLEGAYLGYTHFTPGKFARNWNINFNEWAGWTFGGERRTTGLNTNGGTELHNNWTANFSLDHELPALSVDALRGGPAIFQAPASNLWIGATSDARHPVNVSLSQSLWYEYETSSQEITLEPTVNIRPSEEIQLALTPGVDWNKNAVQYVTRTVADGGVHYVFGTLRQTTAWLTARANYTFTPKLSLQLYAQPFLSAGRYAEFKEVEDPRAHAFDRRYHAYTDEEITFVSESGAYSIDRDGDGEPDFAYENPDFNVKEFRSNLILRWEYRPGSTLYAVWSQGRSDYLPEGRLRLGRDVRRLFSVDATDVLLVKVSYWIDM
jgi:hypothetical protein